MTITPVRLAAALVAAVVAATACDDGGVDDRARRASPRPSPAASPTGPAPARPGQLDVARSEEVTDAVRACARDENVRLAKLKVRVDSDGVLIGIGYRAVGEPARFEDVVEQCLRDAGVTRPEPGG